MSVMVERFNFIIIPNKHVYMSVLLDIKCVVVDVAFCLVSFYSAVV